MIFCPFFVNQVRYQETDRVSEPKEEDISNNATREFTITGLKGYTSYSILVMGKTRIGDGTPSETITIRTSQSGKEVDRSHFIDRSVVVM